MTSEKMLYNEVIKQIENALNVKTNNKDIDNNTKTLFYRGLVMLKEDYGIIATTDFLRGLCSGSEKHKANRVLYLLNAVGGEFKTISYTYEKMFISSVLVDIFDFQRTYITQKDGVKKEVVRKVAYRLKDGKTAKPTKCLRLFKGNLTRRFNEVVI